MSISNKLAVAALLLLCATTAQSDGIVNGNTVGAAPAGAAGGDLSGTYPNPTVAKVNGSTPGGSCSANTFATSLNTSAVPTCTQPSSANLSDLLVKTVTTQQFTTSANSTYTPNAKLLFAIVECVGQGGGGGGAAASATGDSSGGGGGAGSYSRVRLTVAQIGASQAVTNTATTNGGATGNNAGTAGNDTSLGTLCVGKGGSAGGGAAANSAGTAGAGGVVGTGDTTIVGNSGGRGFSAAITTASGPSGPGGTGPWGGGAPGVDASAGIVNGIAGVACGNGGSGGQSEGSASTAAGGSGGPGCVLITEYNSQ